jgi:hypothetical protein
MEQINEAERVLAYNERASYLHERLAMACESASDAAGAREAWKAAGEAHSIMRQAQMTLLDANERLLQYDRRKAKEDDSLHMVA